MRGRAWRARYITRALTGKYPFLLATYQNTVMERLLSDLLAGQKFDIVHIEPFYVWPSIPKTDVPIVCSEHNVEYDVYASYASRFSIPILKPLLYFDITKLKFWERFVWKRVNRVTAVSEKDAAEMKVVTEYTVPIVPNGVDLYRFVYTQQSRKTAPSCLFVGNFRWLPNRDAVSTLLERIWPAIIKELPEATLRIVGRDMPQSIIQKAKSLNVEALPDVALIEDEYRKADFLIAPHAIAGGTKFKMLEAMATGTVIISTTEGVSGLGLSKRIHYLNASSPEEYVHQIKFAWSHRTSRQQIMKQAREFVEKNYGWERISETLGSVWKKTHEEAINN